MIRNSLLTLALVLPSAYADTTLTYTERVADAASASTTLWIKGDTVGVSDGSDGGRVRVLFDKRQSSLVFINHRYRQYTFISESWMKEATQRAQKAMKQMETQMQKQMENIPPQYRGTVQQGRMMMPMMGPMMGGAQTSTAQKSFLPYGNEIVDGRSCRRIDVMEGGKKVQQLCLAAAAALNIPQSDYETFRAMLRLTDRLAHQGLYSLGFKPPAITHSGGSIEGVPVKLEDLRTHSASTLQTLNFDAIDADLLKPPDDYLEAKIPLPVM